MHHSDADTFRLMFFTGLSLLIVGIGYFLPTIIAFARGHMQRWSILILNALLGWTGLIWVYLILKSLDFV